MSVAVHGIVPERWRRPSSYALVVAQLGVGGCVLTALAVAPGLFPVFSALLAALLSILLMYEAVLYWRRKDVACGCFDGDGPVTAWSLGRTAVLALAASGCVSLVLRPELIPGWPELAFVLAAGVAGAVVSRVLRHAAASI
jgi:hypothetical protein